MKQIVWQALVVMLTAQGVLAQQFPPQGGPQGLRQELTIEQMAELKTKKMTLKLDLTEGQQAQMLRVNKDHAAFMKQQAKERHARMASEEGKPSSEERYALENARLEEQIAHQEAVKAILTEEQYQEWKKMRN
ncbi:MAG: hypothetical protein AAGF77_14770, partial [Bacteroidota bacterium]